MDEDIQKYSRLREEEFVKWCKTHCECNKDHSSSARMYFAGFDAAVKLLCKKEENSA